MSDNDAANRLIDVTGGPAAVTARVQQVGADPFIVGRYLGASSGEDQRCDEVGRLGNCASAAALVATLRAVVEPGWFHVADDDRNWLRTVLASTPSEQGYRADDGYCRYVARTGLQKCGISPFAPQQYSNLAYFPDIGRYVFVVVTPPAGVGEAAAAKMIDELTAQGLAEFGG
jgi:hypothetical protein